MMETKISAPWYGYQRKMAAFFDHDPEVEVYELAPDGDGYILPIGVTSAKKAFALQSTLVPKVDFGGVKVTLHIECDEVRDVVKTAFEGNALLDKLTWDDVPGGIGTYVELKPEALQFYNDDISSPCGFSAFLAQDVARDIFDAFQHQTFICSAAGGSDGR